MVALAVGGVDGRPGRQHKYSGVVWMLEQCAVTLSARQRCRFIKHAKRFHSSTIEEYPPRLDGTRTIFLEIPPENLARERFRLGAGTLSQGQALRNNGSG